MKKKKSINYLLFMEDLKLCDQLDSLINTIKISSQDNRISVRRRELDSTGIVLPDEESMEEVDCSGYKYLGVFYRWTRLSMTG